MTAKLFSQSYKLETMTVNKYESFLNELHLFQISKYPPPPHTTNIIPVITDMIFAQTSS